MTTRKPPLPPGEYVAHTEAVFDAILPKGVRGLHMAMTVDGPDGPVPVSRMFIPKTCAQCLHFEPQAPFTYACGRKNSPAHADDNASTLYCGVLADPDPDPDPNNGHEADIMQPFIDDVGDK